MASAKRNEERNEEDNIDLFIAPFQAEYSEALSAAREAAQTTSTTAWQGNYKSNIDAHRKSIKHAIESITSTCEHIEAGDTYEEAEKDIGKAVKRLADERVRFSAWRSRAVQPYESTALKCQSILQSAVRRASDEERDNPLLNLGLVLGVDKRLAAWPRAEWNDDAGAVEISEPAKDKKIG